MRLFILIVLLCLGLNSFTQTIRVNLLAGFSNYYGDLQRKKFTLQQANAVYGVGGTLDITNKLLLRGDYSFGKIGADDKFNPVSDFRSRNLNFKSLIQEGTLLAEYNFFNIYENKFTPYVFAGVGVFKFSPYTMDSAFGKQYLVGLSTEGQGLSQYPDRKFYKTVQLNIPVGGGIKYALSNDIHIGFEYGLRITNTDYLDDVSTTYVDQNTLLNARGPVAVSLAFRGDELKSNPKQYPSEGTLRGGARDNDFYYFGLVRMSIRLNWFDNGGGYGKNQMACPTKVL